MRYNFPQPLRKEFQRLKPAIKSRLEDFRAVPTTEYFYEMCFCLCTPQSKAEHADIVVKLLKQGDFHRTGFDPMPLLRDPAHYIRFHTTKAKRLLAAREQWSETSFILASNKTAEEKREWLAENINGFGWKEASHYLRNIGYRNLPILDRHILKHLVRCGVFPEVPSIGTRKRYFEAAGAFQRFADDIGIPLDEVDLFFWALEAGLVLK